MIEMISSHAGLRMQQRGVSVSFLRQILENADIERSAGDNCRLYRVTREQARSVGNDRLARFAVIWSDDSGRIVTVVPMARNHSGSRYRRPY